MIDLTKLLTRLFDMKTAVILKYGMILCQINFNDSQKAWPIASHHHTTYLYHSIVYFNA